MLRVLAAYHQGDRQIYSMVQVPTAEEEDAKRIHREREHLVQEKVTHRVGRSSERPIGRLKFDTQGELLKWIG